MLLAIKRWGLVLFVACLLSFDAATPLLPGAFRFDPDESIEVLRTSPSPTAALAAVRIPRVFGTQTPTAADSVARTVPSLCPSSFRRLDRMLGPPPASDSDSSISSSDAD